MRVRHVYRVGLWPESQLIFPPVDGSSMNVLFANAIDEFALDETAGFDPGNADFDFSVAETSR